MGTILERRKKLEEVRKNKANENKERRIAKMQKFIDSMIMYGESHYQNAPSYWDETEDYDY